MSKFLQNKIGSQTNAAIRMLLRTLTVTGPTSAPPQILILAKIGSDERCTIQNELFKFFYYLSFDQSTFNRKPQFFNKNFYSFVVLLDLTLLNIFIIMYTYVSYMYIIIHVYIYDVCTITEKFIITFNIYDLSQKIK